MHGSHLTWNAETNKRPAPIVAEMCWILIYLKHYPGYGWDALRLALQTGKVPRELHGQWNLHEMNHKKIHEFVDSTGFNPYSEGFFYRGSHICTLSLSPAMHWSCHRNRRIWSSTKFESTVDNKELYIPAKLHIHVHTWMYTYMYIHLHARTLYII